MVDNNNIHIKTNYRSLYNDWFISQLTVLLNCMSQFTGKVLHLLLIITHMFVLHLKCFKQLHVCILTYFIVFHSLLWDFCCSLYCSFKCIFTLLINISGFDICHSHFKSSFIFLFGPFPYLTQSCPYLTVSVFLLYLFSGWERRTVLFGICYSK